MKSILIIEDDEDIRTLLTDFLESVGYPVDYARDGKEALELLRAEKSRPGLILLDMMMPVMDGPTFQKEVSKEPVHGQVPIVVMTADSNLLKSALQNGAQGGVKKPMDLDDLMATIHKFDLGA